MKIGDVLQILKRQRQMLNDMWYSYEKTNDRRTYNDWTYDNWYESDRDDLDCHQQSDDTQTTVPSEERTNVVPNTASTCDDIKPAATIVRSES